jgi:hypothetical protein
MLWIFSVKPSLSGALRHRKGQTMTLRLDLAILASLLALAGAARAEPLPTDQVISAERDFAADGRSMGWLEAFKKHVAPDAIQFRPGPVNAPANLAKAKPPKPDAPVLAWWPLWVGAARSGDLGFTTGAATIGDRPLSHYFTVWKKQADGSWKWEFDGGKDAPTVSPAGPDAEPLILPAATASTNSADKAMAQVRAAEAVLAAGAKVNVASAYRDLLSPHARTIGWTAVAAEGPAAYYAFLAHQPAGGVAFKTLGGEASKAGDLAWTYGEAAWTADGKAAAGHYVRIWQDSREGWKLVFDELFPDAQPAG